MTSKKTLKNKEKFAKALNLLLIFIDKKNLNVDDKNYDKHLQNVDLSWMKDREYYEDLLNDGLVESDYVRGHNDKELELFKNFLTNINIGHIKNQGEAVTSFKKLKSEVKNEVLIRDVMKELEYPLFGDDLENIGLMNIIKLLQTE